MNLKYWHKNLICCVVAEKCGHYRVNVNQVETAVVQWK
jgi:hypothetical protein